MPWFILFAFCCIILSYEIKTDRWGFSQQYNTFVLSSLISHFSISSAHEGEVTNESQGENKTPMRGFRVCTYVENAGAHFSINFLQCSGSILRLTFWNLLSARRIRKIATTIERNRGRHVIDLAFFFSFASPTAKILPTLFVGVPRFNLFPNVIFQIVILSIETETRSQYCYVFRAFPKCYTYKLVLLFLKRFPFFEISRGLNSFFFQIPLKTFQISTLLTWNINVGSFHEYYREQRIEMRVYR